MFSNTNKVTFLESSNENFNTRQKSVFDELDKLESSRPVNRYTEEQFTESQHLQNKVKVSKNKCLKDKFKGYESIFKTPEGPPPKKQWMKKIPDYQVNPHRWTRYSLSDVSDRDMSEQSNTAAAMDFLRNQGSPITLNDTKSERIKIAPKFSKISSKTSKDIVLSASEVKVTKTQHPLFTSSKREMPEYVVGQKQKKSKGQRPKPAETAEKSIKLSHLFDEDE